MTDHITLPRSVVEQAIEALEDAQWIQEHHQDEEKRCDAIEALRAALAGAAQAEPPFGSRRAAAMAVYTPPFSYTSGYIYDSQNLMVSDSGSIGNDEPGVEGAVAARVRGWGRLGYLPNGAELQDEIGQMMADALNELYTTAQHAAAPQPAQQVAGPLFSSEQVEETLRAAMLSATPTPPTATVPVLEPLTEAEIVKIIPPGAVWQYEIGFDEAVAFIRAAETTHNAKLASATPPDHFPEAGKMVPPAKALTDDDIDAIWIDGITIPQKVQRRRISRAAIYEFCKLNGITPPAEGGV